MSRYEKIELTNMCMVYDDSRVLVQDKIDDNYKGITFPGGHVEKSESFTDAVIREVFEETGLKIFNPQLCGIKDWFNNDGSRYMVLLYKTDKFEGNISSSDEGKVYWIELEEIKNVHLADRMDKMLQVFFDENISEYFFYKDNGKLIDILK